MIMKGFRIVFGLYVITFAADLISTFLNWRLLKYLEANLLYRFIGLAPSIIIHLFIMLFLYKLYQNTESVDVRFYVIFVMFAIILTRVVVVYNNVQLYLHPITLEQAKQVTAGMKNEAIKSLIFLNLLPFLNGALTWIFYRLDHNVKPKPLEPSC